MAVPSIDPGAGPTNPLLNKASSLPTLQPTEAMQGSVQDFTASGRPRITLFQIASVADEAPAWPSLQRDQYLDRFWPKEPFLAGAIFSVASRNASHRWELTGPPEQVEWAQQLLVQANFGQGWQDLVMKLTLDLLCSDNGAFIEIIRPARARMPNGYWHDAIKVPDEYGGYTWYAFSREGGMVGPQHDLGFQVVDSPLDLPIGIAHLDSQRCERTGNPEFPVIYTDLRGKRHLLSSHQVIPLSEMPSPREDHYGYGYCAVSRALRLAQTIRDMEVYKHEKISGRFARAIHLTNIDAAIIQDAVDQSEENADNIGLIRYTQPIVAATLDPNARPGLETIELATMPDGFDEESSLRWYVAGLALDLGVDYGFLAPLPGNRLGTGTQAEAAERQAKGKSSRLFINMMEYVINWGGILPRSIVFRFAVPDPYEESERDLAYARRARARSTQITSGEITPQIAAQLAADRGDLAPEYLAQMGYVDLTPIITVSGTDVVVDSRFVPRLDSPCPGSAEEPRPGAVEGPQMQGGASPPSNGE